MDERYIGTKEAAQKYGYTVQRMCQIAKRGIAPAVRRGRQWFFEKDTLDSYILKGNGRPMPSTQNAFE
jgi:hypothetical protein